MDVIRVLLIEDDPTACALIGAFFDGFAEAELCAVANDGDRGLELIVQQEPDLILLDLVMPKRSGLGVLQWMQENPPVKVSKIVIISQVSNDEIIQKTFQMGADFYLLKPVRLAELSILIRSLFNNSKRCIPTGAAGWFLDQMCTPHEELGYQYIAMAADTLASDESGTMLLKEAYYPIIQKTGTNYQCVEKNIRATIQKIHAAQTPDYYKLMGGMPKRHPSNREFLRALAKALRHQEQQMHG